MVKVSSTEGTTTDNWLTLASAAVSAASFGDFDDAEEVTVVSGASARLAASASAKGGAL